MSYLFTYIYRYYLGLGTYWYYFTSWFYLLLVLQLPKNPTLINWSVKRAGYGHTYVIESILGWLAIPWLLHEARITKHRD